MSKEDQSKVKVTKLTIQVGGKTLELSIEDAKQLRDELNDVLVEQKPSMTYVYTFPIWPQSFGSWPIYRASTTSGAAGSNELKIS